MRSKDIAVKVAEFIINDTSKIRGMDSCLNELLTDYERAKAREMAGPAPRRPKSRRAPPTRNLVGKMK